MCRELVCNPYNIIIIYMHFNINHFCYHHQILSFDNFQISHYPDAFFLNVQASYDPEFIFQASHDPESFLIGQTQYQVVV